MHKFLRAVGFSNMKKEEFKEICRQIADDPTVSKTAIDSEGNQFLEISGEFGDSFGVTLRGTTAKDGTIEVDYYYPYIHGSKISTLESIDVEKYAEKEAYAGICEEMRLSVTLIFYLQNVAEYLNRLDRPAHEKQINGAKLGALSTEGKILLPISSEAQERAEKILSECRELSYFMTAGDGNELLPEHMGIGDMDMFYMLSRRYMDEDILSIINTYFMPYGVENDQYTIMGQILDFDLVENRLSGEKIYRLEIKCNNMVFCLCINQKDLLGEPQVGRRFKGDIWMQGVALYKELV